MSEPRGAGIAGGLLFAAVVLFLGYLAIVTIVGFVRWLVGMALVIAVIVLIVRVLNRR